MATTNGSQPLDGYNPLLKVVLSLGNGEVMWRHYCSTYNVEFIAAK